MKCYIVSSCIEKKTTFVKSIKDKLISPTHHDGIHDVVVVVLQCFNGLGK